MKTTVLALSIFILGCLTSLTLAQGKNELKMSYGYSGLDAVIPGSLQTANAVGCAFANITLTTISLLIGSTNPSTVQCKFELESTGTIGINYNKILNEKLSVGGQLNFSNYKYRYHNNKRWTKVNIIATYAKIEYRYITQPKFEMYGSAMAGIIGNRGKNKSAIPTLHLTALGFRHGTQHAIFYELGLGTGHLVSIGYSAKI